MTLCQSPGQGQSLGSQHGSGWGGDSSGIWLLSNSMKPFTTQSNKRLELSFWENQAAHIGNRRSLSPKLLVGQWVWQ